MYCKEIHLRINDDVFGVVKFNQYDRNYPVNIILDDYEIQEGEKAKIEWYVPGIAVIQGPDDITTVKNNGVTTLIFKLRRELFLNGTQAGYFNAIIYNPSDDSRVATFKKEFEVVSNSIDENTVNEAMVETVIENLQEEENKANEIYENLNKSIEKGSLNNYATKEELTQGQKDTINLMWPIGSYRDFRINVNPNDLYTWQKWEKDISGTVLVSCTENSADSEFGTLGNVSGTKNQTAKLDDTAFAQIAIGIGTGKIFIRQKSGGTSFTSNVNLAGNTDITGNATYYGAYVVGKTNEFNNCMPYRTSQRWYRTA